MVRAKRTDRADARRRSRAAAVDTADVTAPAATPAPSRPAAAQRSSQSTAEPTRGRPSLFTSFRAAYRPVHLREDIRMLPWLVTRTHAVWLPSLLIVAATGWYWASGGAVGFIAAQRFGGFPGLAFNLFVFPPPLGAAFLAGILAPRMSYMAGLIAGIVSFVCFSVFMMLGPAGVDLPAGLRESWVLYGLTISPLAGLGFGAAAGFYRRFLAMVNPNARSRGQGKGKTTKAAARR